MTVRSLDPVALADCFAELAGVFGAPLEEADIAGLIENGGFEALRALAGDARHAVDLNAAVAALKVAGTAEAATARLNAVYCRLFLGVGGSAATLPIESAWRGNGRLFQQPVADMNALLAELDIRAELDGEPADHVAIETGLLAQLVADAHPARAALADRLAAWLPGFQDALVVTDPTGFYAGAATALLTAVERERAL